MLVGPDGALLASLPEGRPGWLKVELPVMSGGFLTAYARGGWLLLPLISWVTVGLAVLLTLRRRQFEQQSEALK